MRAAPIAAVMERFYAADPDPRCELYHRTDFQLLLSVMLSAQTTDKSVNAAVQPLYDAGLDPQQLLALGEVKFLATIRRIGLAPTKAKRAMTLAHAILTQHDGQVPRTRAALEALPGVGTKTASVVLGELFRHPTLAVDTHVFRVTGRLGWHRETTASGCEQVLNRLIDDRYKPQAHHWLVLHGRYVCKARRPECGRCLLADLCPSADPGRH